MTNGGEVLRVVPAAAIPGAEVAIEYEAVSAEEASAIGFSFDGNPAPIVAAGRSRALVRLPVISSEPPIHITTTIAGAAASEVTLIVGRSIISDVHPVANPTFHPTDGSLYVTRSGSRGEHVPVSIFRINSDGTVEEFSSDILNPTGIAFDPMGRMYVTSR